MKRIKYLLVCTVFSVLALGITGCGNDNSGGSSTQSTGAATNGAGTSTSATKAQNSTSGTNSTTGNNNGTNNNTNGNNGTKGDNIIDDVGDAVETIVGDVATAAGDMVR